MSRKTAAQENIQEDGGRLDSRYECPICLYWLNQPMLTNCGHRFCKKCLDEWFKKHDSNCPYCNLKLSKEDVFQDNCLAREINAIILPCTYAVNGCTAALSPFEMEKHLLICAKRAQTVVECPFARQGCTFQTSDKQELDDHNKVDMPNHLKMLLKAVNLNQGKSIEATKLWDAPKKNFAHSKSEKCTENEQQENGGESCSFTADDYKRLLQEMYERIVSLEQSALVHEAKIRHLEENPRYNDGILIWQIPDFNTRIQQMSANPKTMYYSPDMYTSQHGYRFCARINISPKAKTSIGLHVHLMKSKNDFHLDWPFRGCFKIWMIHPDAAQKRADKIMTNEKVLAFERPKLDVCPRGFGFIEYATINEIQTGGFLTDDTLTIKFHITIV